MDGAAVDPRRDDVLRRVANEHWLTAYRQLIASIGGEWRQFGSVAAFASPGVPVPFANGCLVLESATVDDLAAAAGWVDRYALPYRIRFDTRVETRELAAVPRELGLARDEWLMPGMVLTPIPEAPAPGPGISVRRVDAANHTDFITLMVDSGLPHAVALSAFAAPAPESDMAMFVAYLDGELVGTSVAVRTGSVAGIYTVGTVASARGRGVGSATTWAAVEQARLWGCTVVVLQSSRLGLHVYERMGFRSVVEYAVYSRA
jgi:GNAT superfamily N-acetyltransferase